MVNDKSNLRLSTTRMNATESTPLLAHSLPVKPSISPIVERLQSQETSTLDKNSVLALCSTPSLPSAGETALVLIVLLQLKAQEKHLPSPNVWDQWTHDCQRQSDEERLGNRALEVWSQYVDNWCTNEDLVEVLATRFPLDESGRNSAARTSPRVVFDMRFG